MQGDVRANNQAHQLNRSKRCMQCTTVAASAEKTILAELLRSASRSPRASAHVCQAAAHRTRPAVRGWRRSGRWPTANEPKIVASTVMVLGLVARFSRTRVKASVLRLRNGALAEARKCHDQGDQDLPEEPQPKTRRADVLLRRTRDGQRAPHGHGTRKSDAAVALCFFRFPTMASPQRSPSLVATKIVRDDIVLKTMSLRSRNVEMHGKRTRRVPIWSWRQWLCTNPPSRIRRAENLSTFFSLYSCDREPQSARRSR